MSDKPRILLVDDSPTQLLLTEMTLTRGGVEVITARNGVEGVSKAYVERPDLIISDIIMPELNGYQLCRLLKNDRAMASIPIILLTSLDQQLDRFWGIKAGANRFLLKGSPPEIILGEVRSLLENANTTIGSERLKTDNTASEVSESVASRVNYMLDRLLLESTISQETLKLADFIDDRNRLIEEYVNLVGSLVDYSCLMVLLIDHYEAILAIDFREKVAHGTVDRKKTQTLHYAKGISADLPIVHSLLNEELVFDGDGPDFQSEICTPLHIGNEFLGSINVFSLRQRAFSQAAEESISLLTKDFTMVAKLSMLYEENRRLSITDGLTKVYNHRYFQESLQKSIATTRRYGQPLSLIILDIDHFKTFNDTYGHQQGDLILAELARLLRRNTRQADLVARYGGEEFVIILPETELNMGVAVAENLRRIVDEHPFPGPNQPLHVSISAGVSTASPETSDNAELIKAADRALYRAKEMGRNRVETAG